MLDVQINAFCQLVKIPTWPNVGISLEPNLGSPTKSAVGPRLTKCGLPEAHKPTQSSTFAQFGLVGWVVTLAHCMLHTVR
jgi:hypothetical protein